MNTRQFKPLDPASSGDEEPAGAERYLLPGEQLRICSSDIQIKKFRFEAYLTNRRLFLIDQHDPKPGLTAKEIPVESILAAYLEDSPAHEPVIVISVRSTDDDIRTMKMTYAHTGEDRALEAEEWVHLIAHASLADIDKSIRNDAAAERPQSTHVISPEARSLSDTMIVPSSGKRHVPERPVVKKEELVPSYHQVPKNSGATPTTPKVLTQITYCFHCGRKLPLEANFCPYCGTRVHQIPHDEEGQVHQAQESVSGQMEPEKKSGWKRFFRK